MTTLRDAAGKYEPPQTLNIADLPKVPVDMEVFDGEGVNQKGESYTYQYAEFNGKKYRIPGPVLEQLKKMLKLKPTLAYFKVEKTGSGVSTKYDVEPLD